MRAEGTVLRTDGETAEVEVVQRSACVGCSAAVCDVREGQAGREACEGQAGREACEGQAGREGREACEGQAGRGDGGRADCVGCGVSGSSGGSGGSGCAGCHKAVRHVLTLKNDVGAQVGDRVYVESRTGVIFALCGVLFLLPLLVAAAVYAAFWGGKDSGAGALVAFVTALSSFALLYLTAGKRLVKRCEYRMRKIIG